MVSRNNFLVMFSLSLSPPFMHIPLLGVVSFGQGFYDYCNVYWGGGGGGRPTDRKRFAHGI